MSNKSKLEREAQLARIRALMAKTVDNGCSEAEAKSAAAAVDRLLATYEIDLDEVTVKEQEIVQLSVAGGDHVVQFAASKIAAFTDCISWMSGHKYLVYLGFKVDTEISEYLTLVFRRAIDRETADFTVFNADYEQNTRAGQFEMVSSFGIGMAIRLGERLAELKSKRDFSQRTSGRDLVAIKFPLVKAAFDALNMKFGKGRSGRAIGDTEAYNAGRSAAESVAISQGVAGRGQVGGRLK